MATNLLCAYEVITCHCTVPLLWVLDFIENIESVSSSQGTTISAIVRPFIPGIITSDVQDISILISKN